MGPTRTIVDAAASSVTAIDRKGRSFELRRLTALDTLRLFKAAGPVLSQNESWLAMASLVSSVKAIDGVPVPSPINEAQIEALVDRLGEEGLAAIAGSGRDEEKAAVSPELVGNLQGIPS